MGRRVSGGGVAALVLLLGVVAVVGGAAAAARGSPSVSAVAGRDCLACHVSVSASRSGLVAGPLRGFPAAGWSIGLGAVAGLVTGLAAIGLLEAVRVIRGGPSHGGGVVFSLRGLVVDALLQRRVLLDPGDSLVHLPIYVGGVLLLVAGVLYLAEPGWALSPFAGHPGYYRVFRLLSNVGGFLVLLGVLWGAERRLLGLRPGLESVLDDWLVLAALAALVLSGMAVDAASAVAHGAVGWLDASSVLLRGLWAGVAVEQFPGVYFAALAAHIASLVAVVVSIGWGKLRHLVLAPASLALRRSYMPATAAPVPDAEKRVEEGGYLGAVKPGDLSWRLRLDFEACTRCARCTAVCPAYASGRPLSPMHLVQSLREAVERGDDGQLVPVVVRPETLWSCTNCGACVHACPVGVHHVEAVTELRRGLVSLGENVPEELLQVSYSLMRTGNPYGSDPYEKEQWINRLAEQGLVEIAEPGKEYDILLWVGCAPAYDPRLRGTVESLLRLLRRAGLSVAVAPGQQCCGEPARRIGDELMFQELVRMNTEELSQYRFRRILVTCPHGLHVLRHEYPLYGAPRWEVVHHSQLLAELLREGKLRPARQLPVAATYHDPCYLGRWNRVYDDPREVAKAAVSELREMPRSREKSFCCGGGGGGVFYDPKIGKRPARIRVEEAKNTGAKVLAVACPFCNIMLSAEAPDYDIEVRDIAELLDQATSSEAQDTGRAQ